MTAVDRFTVNNAFQSLLQKDEGGGPYVACERLNTALRTGQVKLWADDTEVNPTFFAGHLYVTVAAEPGGGWIAKLSMRQAVDQPKEWSLSGLGGLLESKPELPRRQPGPATTHDWIWICGVIARLSHSGVPDKKLTTAVRECCRAQGRAVPDETAVRKALKQFLAAFRGEN